MIALITGWAASATDWLNCWGPIAWVAAGLLAAFLTTFSILSGMYIYAYFGLKRAERDFYISRNTPSDTGINPLDDTFTKKRIYPSQIRHPVTNLIEKKTFVDCDLLGPGTVLLMGARFDQTKFGPCTFVKGTDMNFDQQTLTVLHDCVIRRGTVSLFTFIIPPEFVSETEKQEFFTGWV